MKPSWGLLLGLLLAFCAVFAGASMLEPEVTPLPNPTVAEATVDYLMAKKRYSESPSAERQLWLFHAEWMLERARIAERMEKIKCDVE